MTLRLRSARLVAAVVLVLTGSGFAQQRPFDWGDNPEPRFAKTTALCRAVKDRRPPAAEQPKPAEIAALKGCDAEALYYGIGRPRDPAAALRCALAWPSAQVPGQVFDNQIMLMTLYANGDGGRRDIDLAMHISCGVESAPMENVLRTEALRDLKAGGPGPKRFDYCDSATSGHATGFCAKRDARLEDTGREGRLATLTQGFTAPQRKAFDALRASQRDFAQLRSREEIDLSGTLRGVYGIEEEQAQTDAFLAMLTRFQGGAFRRDAGPQAAAADARLNVAYRRLQSGAPAAGVTMSNAGVRTTERAWIRYRDAWVAFAKARAPGAPTSGLVAALTAERAQALEALGRDWKLPTGAGR